MSQKKGAKGPRNVMHPAETRPTEPCPRVPRNAIAVKRGKKFPWVMRTPEGQRI